MSRNRRRINPQNMTIYEQLEKIKEEMCDSYCKYIMLNRNGDISNQRFDECCNHCPLNKL